LVRFAQVALFGASLLLSGVAVHAQSPRRDSTRVASPGRDTTQRGRPGSADSAGTDSLTGLARLLGSQPTSDLTIDLLTRLETKAERTKNERCNISAVFSVGFTCRSAFTPALDAQFSLKARGGFADRVKVDVDYDTEREFDGSNAIGIAYEGRPNDRLQRVEVGNVFFRPPPSRFITAGIPSGNFGVQAMAKFGSMRLTAIAAQQKGNVMRDQVFTIGARTTQAVEREIEDYQIEPRRFFFTVDPLRFGAAYPNIDILDARQMNALAAALPDTVRPSRLFVYRLILGGQPPNPNGPRFQLLGDPLSRPGQVYELLRENVDYYVDPSQLWIALVRPLALNNERLVVAYPVRLNGRDTVVTNIGGTPDLEYIGGKTQLANLLWDPQVTPQHPAFRREIRSVYRLGGEDLRRQSVQVRIVAGTSADQEKPPGGAFETYLQLFGLSQLANASTFDRDNRLWPRPNDPNFLVTTTPGTQIFRDQFLVFPSLEPFSRRGLARPPEVAANDTIYRTPSEYVYSSQHPQSYYRLRVNYEVDGGGALGTIALNSVQIRPESERLMMDGRLLVKGVDYDIDYELGRVQLLRPDTLISRARRVVVRYEENPLFASIPTSIFGLSSQWSSANGQVSLVAISQTQRSTFTRPPLGFEPQASVVVGMAANYGWALPTLTGALDRLAFGRAKGAQGAAARPARLEVQAEFAVSQPRAKSSQQAFIESFEGEGGININLFEAQWGYSSQPALGSVLPTRFEAATFDTSRATTMAFQNGGVGRDGKGIQFTFSDIDPQATLTGLGFSAPEQMLWMTMYPLSVGGIYDATTARYRWQTGKSIPGRRWRSIRTVLGQGGSGIDLSRGEQLEFWTLVYTDGARRQRNPTIVLDFGDVSENSVGFSPETLAVASGDTLYRGKQLVGFDRLDTERDPFSRSFNADVNDLGLPGDVVDQITVVGGTRDREAPFRICALGLGRTRPLGDVGADCTVRNGRLDEEDIDQDGSLNFTSGQRDLEQLRRFIVDLSDPRSFSRVGHCNISVPDVNSAATRDPALCWVQVKLPFTAPADSIAGGPPLRRVRALRMTVVSGLTVGDNEFSLVPVARLRVLGSPWLKRSDRPLRGIAGSQQTLGGTVIATVIGTQDRDSTRGIFYESPPGVVETADQAQAAVGAQRILVNERSMRLLSVGLAKAERAEAFYRFPEGQRNLMGYRELRMWARGRGRGWGTNGDLQFFVKLGRDADNFYMYRSEVNAGNARSAWEPEIRVRFEKFYALRAILQNAFLQGRRDLATCHGIDSVLVAASGLPAGARIDRYAACQDGYIVYTVDPAVTPPNLAAVQEVAVGMVRVDSLAGSEPPFPNDTLELWADDIRLADVVNTAGYAGEVSATLSAGDFGSVRVGVRRRDPNFRQLGEQPSFLTNDDLDLTTTWRLDRFLPSAWGYALPLTITHRASGASPEFVSRSDIRGASVPGLRAPRADQTSYSLSARRVVPLVAPWLAPVLNNLVLDGVVNTLGNRTEFQNGRVRDLNVAVDYSSAGFLGTGGGDAADSGHVGAPGISLPFLQGQRLPLRLAPTQVRLTSVVVRASDSRASYLKPALAFDDSARVVSGEQRVWRNVSSFELQPLKYVTARWDAVSVHDLRDYGDSTLNAIAASRERSQLGGLDIGLERERTMTTSLIFAPVTRGWLRPRVVLGSTYSMVRDPNNRAISLLSDAADTPVPRLARRLGNTQVLTASAAFDPAMAVGQLTGDKSRLHRIFSVIRPIDVTVSRNQLSSFDGLPVTPGYGFQFGIGGIDDFRTLGGINASSAAASTDLVVSNTIVLPGGLTIANRVQRTDARQFNRRQESRLSVVNGDQSVYPDVSLRWGGRPLALSGIFSNVGITARALKSRQAWVTPSDFQAGRAEVRSSRVHSYPFSGNAVTAVGQVAFSAALAYTTQVDSLPGSVARRTSSNVGADVSKSFPLPSRWKLASPLRTRMSWQESLTQSFVSNADAFGSRSRLTDNGRRAFSINADTDVAENMTFSLQGARVVTFDRNFDRRQVQTVITAVFQLQFFSGAMK
jgi:hypothetical protein